MSGRKIAVHHLAEMVCKTISKYDAEVAEELEAECKAVAVEGRKKLKQNSPKLTGDYRKGWKVKVAYRSLTDFRYVIHNKTDYQLTHLLENTHSIKNGTGRVYGRSKAMPHIKPVEEWMEQELRGRVKVRIRQIY